MTINRLSRRTAALFPLFAGLLLAAALLPPGEAFAAGKTVTMPSGLNYIDTVEGKGASPKRGQTCVMLMVDVELPAIQ